MLAFRVLYEDDCLIAVDKPPGFHTHPPEDAGLRISPRWNGLHILERQFGHRLYPVHRLDRASSGVLVLSKARELNAGLQRQFAEQSVFKRYALVARGRIPGPLRLDESLKHQHGSVEAVTELDPVFSFSLPLPAEAGREPRSFTLAWARPVTGRFHQIRRHCARAGHPLLGDNQHGDKKLNRAVAGVFRLNRLFLRCMEMRLRHPLRGQEIIVRARWSRDWHRLFAEAGFCPLAGGAGVVSLV